MAAPGAWLGAQIERALQLDRSQEVYGLRMNLEHVWDPSILLSLHAIYHGWAKHVVPHFRTIDSNGRIAHVLWDTSSNGEFGCIWEAMNQHGGMPELGEQIVVDVGAMDGVSGSNSFNFIQMGWYGIVIEPLPQHVKTIKSVLQPWEEAGTVAIEAGVLSEVDGSLPLTVYDDSSRTSNSIKPSAMATRDDLTVTEVIQVASMTARTLARKYRLPTHFGVLSIDAEGAGDEILRAFMVDGLRPRYIVVETSRGTEPAGDSAILMPYGYRLLRFLWNNNIWEHTPVLNIMKKKNGEPQPRIVSRAEARAQMPPHHPPTAMHASSHSGSGGSGGGAGAPKPKPARFGYSFDGASSKVAEPTKAAAPNPKSSVP